MPAGPFCPLSCGAETSPFPSDGGGASVRGAACPGCGWRAPSGGRPWVLPPGGACSCLAGAWTPGAGCGELCRGGVSRRWAPGFPAGSGSCHLGSRCIFAGGVSGVRGVDCLGTTIWGCCGEGAGFSVGGIGRPLIISGCLAGGCCSGACLADGGVGRPLMTSGCFAAGCCSTRGVRRSFFPGLAAGSGGCCWRITLCGSLCFRTGISAPGRPGLNTDPFSSRTSGLSRLISSHGQSLHPLRRLSGRGGRS